MMSRIHIHVRLKKNCKDMIYILNEKITKVYDNKRKYVFHLCVPAAPEKDPGLQAVQTEAPAEQLIYMIK